MRNKLIWGLGALIILLVGATVFVYFKDRADIQQREAALKKAQEELRQRTAPSQVSGESGHFHADGTFHEGEHENPFDTAPGTWTPTQVKKPAGITDPKVKAAWEKLEYISKNRQKWGNFSPIALELMDELTPVPSIYDTVGSSEDCGGEFIPTLDALCKLRDPRSAELLVSYEMDSGVSGDPPNAALLAMGPAAVPALIARMDDISGETSLSTPLDLLPRIVESHRSELGGIVQHIIIPKIEKVAVSEANVFFADGNKQLALNALEAIRQKPKNR